MALKNGVKLNQIICPMKTIKHLLKSVGDNPSSIKTLKKLHEVLTKYFITVHASHDNALIRSINLDNTNTFIEKVSSILRNGEIDNNGIFRPASIVIREMYDAIIKDIPRIDRIIKGYKTEDFYNDLFEIKEELSETHFRMSSDIYFYTDVIPELIPYRKGLFWGFSDIERNIIIECKYDRVSFFYKGKAIVYYKNNKLVIDSKGFEVIPSFNQETNRYGKLEDKHLILGNGEKLEFDEIKESYFGKDWINNRIYKVKKNGKIGIIDKVGRELVPCKYVLINESPDDSSIYNTFGEEGWGLVNINGAAITQSKYNEINSHYNWIAFGENNRYGITDKKGNLITDYKFEEVGELIDGIAFACLFGDKYGYINEKGEWVIFPQFDEAENFIDGLAMVSNQTFYDSWICSFNDNEEYPLYGLIDKTGEWIVACKYLNIKDFHEGLAAVCDTEERWGFIDKKGEEVISCKYCEVKNFSGGLAAFKSDYSTWGYINHFGMVIIDSKYDEAYNFINGHAIVVEKHPLNSVAPRTNSYQILIDKQGKELQIGYIVFNPYIEIGENTKEGKGYYFSTNGTEFYED